jgi:hypothetical protein
MSIRLITREDEWFKTWLLKFDPDLAFHPQLNNYFLANTEQFGAMCQFIDDKPVAVGMYSKFNGISYLHRQYGAPMISKELLDFLGSPAEIFVVKHQTLETGLHGWDMVLETKPAMIVDHSAYSGVFWRTVPWYHGNVYRRGFNA